MHVLFIADADSKYGAPTSMFQMISAMKRLEEIDISVVLTPKSEMGVRYRGIGCNVYYVPYAPFYQGIPYNKALLPIKFVKTGIEYYSGKICALRCLESQIDLTHIDMIHANSSREDFCAQISQKYNKPLIWHIREFGDLDFNCYSYRKNYIEYINKCSTVVVAISDAVKVHWAKKGIDINKIKRIYNGVVYTDDFKTEYNNNSILKLIIVGSVGESKGQREAIEAISFLNEIEKKSVHLDIVGDGSNSYKKRLIDMIHNYKLSEQVSFLGYRKDAYKILSSYDCGLMCSRNEAFGRTTVEYMMTGLPVIASNSGANMEILTHMKNGLLYDAHSPENLSKNIAMLLNNRNLLRELGTAAREEAISRFTSEINARNILDLYKSIVTQHTL